MSIVTTAAGAKVYISTTIQNADLNQTQFEALSWTEVEEVESLGRFGDRRQTTEFTTLGDQRTRTYPGALNAGTMSVVCGKKTSDPGQAALKAALAAKDNYGIKVELLDAPQQDYSNTILFFRGLVVSGEDDVGNNANVIKTNFDIKVNSDIIEVEPHFVT